MTRKLPDRKCWTGKSQKVRLIDSGAGLYFKVNFTNVLMLSVRVPVT